MRWNSISCTIGVHSITHTHVYSYDEFTAPKFWSRMRLYPITNTYPNDWLLAKMAVDDNITSKHLAEKWAELQNKPGTRTVHPRDLKGLSEVTYTCEVHKKKSEFSQSQSELPVCMHIHVHVWKPYVDINAIHVKYWNENTSFDYTSKTSPTGIHV